VLYILQLPMKSHQITRKKYHFNRGFHHRDRHYCRYCRPRCYLPHIVSVDHWLLAPGQLRGETISWLKQNEKRLVQHNIDYKVSNFKQSDTLFQGFVIKSYIFSLRVGRIVDTARVYAMWYGETIRSMSLLERPW